MFRMNRRRVEVEMHELMKRARLVPFVIFVAGRHERQFPLKVPER